MNYSFNASLGSEHYERKKKTLNVIDIHIHTQVMRMASIEEVIKCQILKLEVLYLSFGSILKEK